MSALLGVRVAPAIRALIDEAGSPNAATRALIILGAASAGQDVRHLAGAIHALIGSGALRDSVAEALGALLGRGAITPAITCDSRGDSRAFLEDPLADPLGGIGIEV